MNSKKSEDYVMPFGKFKGMRAVDIAEIYIVDKNGVDQPTGLKYLEWLVLQPWFKHTEIITSIIETAKSCISEGKPEE